MEEESIFKKATFVLIYFLVSAAVLKADAQEKNETTFRICVPSGISKICETMETDMSTKDGRIECVAAQDKVGCIAKIVKNEADFIPLEPEEIFVAQKFKRSIFNVIGEIRTIEFKDRDYRYEPVAVIRKSSQINSISDLRGKKSCHTGFGRNAGWKVPFSHLMDRGELTELCAEVKAPTPERDIYTFSKYFSKGCAPGQWAADSDSSAELQEKYSNMCALCDKPKQCNRDDKYGDYEGALKCLTQNDGDVAWTKMDAVQNFFNIKPGSSISSIALNYAFLCWDGSSEPLNTTVPCSWAKRPWRAYLASSRLSASEIEDLQKQIEVHLETAKSTSALWDSTVLELNSSSEITEFYNGKLAKISTPYNYLSSKNYSVIIEKPSCSASRKVKICVKNILEKMKCDELALGSLGRGIIPGFECIKDDSFKNCSKRVAIGEADAVFASAKDAAESQCEFGLTPILSELEITNSMTVPGNKPELGPFHYSLAVIRSDEVNIKNITDLIGKKSCHGSIKSLAGWNAPLMTFRKEGLLKGPTCGSTIEILKIFNKTCVPGAIEEKAKMKWLPNELCGLCAGDSSLDKRDEMTPGSFCANSPAEQYFGSGGALKCLVDSVADVAFVDHMILNDLPSGLKETDFQLLCPKGGYLVSLPVSDYKHCNWGKVPSSRVLARGNGETEGDIFRKDAQLSLLRASDTFSKLFGVFKFFGPYYSNKNVLVQDTSVKLVNYVKDDEMNDLIESFDFCTTSSASKLIYKPLITPLVSICTITFAIRYFYYNNF